MNYIEAVKDPDFSVDFYGDPAVNPQLEQEVRSQGAQSRIRLCGFCDRPQDLLPSFDLFIYLLNPTHYGTTENALLEAMACGAVPIVLNNPVESGIVQHGVTGFVVEGPETFAATVRYLLDHPEERQRIGEAGAQAVRRDYSVAQSAGKLADLYRAVMKSEKKTLDFSAAFGQTPADMFLSCLGDYAACFAQGDQPEARARRRALPFLYEQSKSSVFHFRDYFPEDARLAAWEALLSGDKAVLSRRPKKLKPIS
jgi:hypothetical protein